MIEKRKNILIGGFILSTSAALLTGCCRTDGRAFSIPKKLGDYLPEFATCQ